MKQTYLPFGKCEIQKGYNFVIINDKGDNEDNWPYWGEFLFFSSDPNLGLCIVKPYVAEWIIFCGKKLKNSVII